MRSDLYEERSFEVSLTARLNGGTGNRKLRDIGSTLFYDIFTFDAPDVQDRQPETLLDLDLNLDTSEVDAQQDVT